MVDYSIAAIPTVYKGRTYRSRLEARWAAFFDRLQLDHEYEPFDLGEWSPDFLLPEINTLVEVKPLTEFDPHVWAKIVAASKRVPERAVLLTTVAPQLDRVVYIGWMGHASWDSSMAPIHAAIGWYPGPLSPLFLADIVGRIPGKLVSAGGEMLTLREFGIGNHYEFPHSYSDHTMELWAEATSDVQWPGPGRA